MPWTNFPNGFANGLSVRGMPLLQMQPGQVFFLSNSAVVERDSRGGSDSNRGTFLSPFGTLAGALSHCLANNGDIIFVGPGHAETIADATTTALNVAGVAVIGLGSGSLRPTFTWSLATSTIKLAASNMSMQNCIFIGAAATTFVAAAFTNANTVVATDFALDNCEFRDLDATHGFVAGITTGTTANQADGMSVTNCKVIRRLTSPPAANTLVVHGATIDRFQFGGNYINNLTVNNNIPLGFDGTVYTNLMCWGNKTHSPNTGTTAGELFGHGGTTSSGLVWDNYSWHLAATGLLAITGTKLGFVNNYCSITGAADKSSLLNPVAV